MQVGDLVWIKRNPKTISFGIAGGPGRITQIENGKVFVFYTDRVFGSAGPFELSEDDIELVKEA